MADAVIHQIYFKEDQKAELFPFAIPYFNETLTPFFENSIISELVMKSQADKIAVCSWSLRRKMKMRIPPRRELTEECLQEEFDVLAFTKNTPDHEMLKALDEWHPGSKVLLKLIFDELGAKWSNKPKFPIYQNAFCAKKEIYQGYVAEFLEPAMNLMQTDDEIRKMCWQDAQYSRTTLNIPVDSERMQKFLGVPYAPLHPFLLERCFSIWIDSLGLNVKYL